MPINSTIQMAWAIFCKTQSIKFHTKNKIPWTYVLRKLMVVKILPRKQILGLNDITRKFYPIF